MGSKTSSEREAHNQRATALDKPCGNRKLDGDLGRIRTDMIRNYSRDADKVDRALVKNLSTKIRFDDYRRHYTMGACLKEGGFGTVYRCTGKNDGCDYAVKVMKKVVDLKDDRDTVREINLMLHADHPNLVQIREVYHMDGKPLALVMNLIEPGTDKHGKVMATADLMSLLMQGPLSMPDTARVIHQTAAAVNFLNTHCHAMHRDLKPDNILIGPEMFQRIRVADYGQARIFQADEMSESGVAKTFDVGTSGYNAPETMSMYNMAVGAYGPKIDVWSLGVITYICASGTTPFPLSGGKARGLIMKGQYRPMAGPKWEGVESECKELIASMLVVDPDRRISMLQVMSHPWVLGHH